jgi:Domain of unknown function (DUF4349)
MDRFDDDSLTAELRAVRPAPRPEFAADLDQRAAAGFPRRSSPYAATSPFVRLADRWRAMSPRRRLVPVMAALLAALVVATGIVTIAGSDGSHRSVVADTMTSGLSTSAGTLEEGGAASAESAEAGGEAEATGGAGAPIEAAPMMEAEGTKQAGEKAPKAANTALAPLTRSGGRDIERSASVVLGTKPGEVAGASAKVYEAVHAADGVVLHSSVQSSSAGATGASFELLIPSRKLDDTLAAFSQIAEVRERHDATNDITKQTVGAGEELADSNATIESLLGELGAAETETEREALETRLREERRRHAAIETSLEHLHKRATMSEVSLRIVTDHGAGVTPAGKGSGGWSVGDALHDAGQILTVAAGILLVALAVLAPIALIALLVWLTNRFRVRRLRERTLG